MAIEAAVGFHRTGVVAGSALASLDGARLRPALFARFRNLSRLRYDFPLILVEGRADGTLVETLSGRIDALLANIAEPGAGGDPRRRLVLRLERAIRAGVATKGSGGSFAEHWDAAAARLSAEIGEAATADLERARAACPLDGVLVDCDAALAARFVGHVWRAVEERRASAALAWSDELRRRLEGLVRADFLRSAAGRDAAQLRVGVGTPHQDLFDFERMARLLAAPSGASGLAEARRRRLEGAAAVLRRLVLEHAGLDDYAFESLEAAVAAYRERMPAVAELVRAIAIAELEVGGRYVEAVHDPYFAGIDPTRLAAEDGGFFPGYLVTLQGGAAEAAMTTPLLAVLATGAPLKVLAAIDDPLGPSAALAEAAVGLGSVFVVQTSAAHLWLVRERIRAALEHPGPALIVVYTGAIAGRPDLAPYLVAAAAVESRALPAFSYDPAAGPGWAERLSLDDNPQPDRRWTRHELEYADAAMQRVIEEVPVTPADLALCDPRQATHFARLGAGEEPGGLVPLEAWLQDGADGHAGVPYVYAVDTEDRLERVVVDARLARVSRQRGEAWERLRQLDSLKVAPIVAAAPSAVEAASGAAGTPSAASEALAVGPPSVAPAPPSAAEPVVEASAPGSAAGPTPATPDDPYIETPRCTTCNECTGINSRMFAYDENRQAYIADPDQGTYRELVEAAERCQVAIIHPGKPRNDNEPGLAELIERAAVFA